MADLVWLIIALPLAGAVGLHFVGRRLREPIAGRLASAAIGGAFVVAVIAAVPFVTGAEHSATHLTLWEWMPAIGASFEIQWDALSALMALVVTGVGTLIHVYAIGYMHGDERFGRFFTYLNLFAASMLTLVLAGNFAMLFLGWELVGLCSYLLISFWFTRPAAASAGKKAFVVNRVGDFGFMVGLMIVFTSFGTLSFAGVLTDPGATIGRGTATGIGLLLLLGAAGKSAQIPLYVWLPDAMEGPTPVSALIHAATMVTAGIYLVARTAPIFELAPAASLAVAIIGAATALWAATIAIAQQDIKRVLAYSTISQLGYMFLAVGVTAYAAGIFHLMTHAFFKALLFLGAGSVIHGLGGEQNMDKMGGLWRKMPITAATMGIATLAIAGIPPLAGFWSKDEILGSVFARGGGYLVLWAVGLVTALLTAFYMARQFFLVFGGAPRWDEGVEPHESPRVMTLPLLALAGLSVLGGFANTPFRTGLERFLHPVFEAVTQVHPDTGLLGWVLAGVSVLAGVTGIGIAAGIYLGSPQFRERVLAPIAPLWRMWERGYRIDDLYSATIVRPGLALSHKLAFTVDTRGVDGALTGVAKLVGWLSGFVRPLQSGLVRSYGLMVAVGVAALLVWFVGVG